MESRSGATVIDETATLALRESKTVKIPINYKEWVSRYSGISYLSNRRIGTWRRLRAIMSLSS